MTFQFSIRTAMATTLITSILLAFYAFHQRSLYQRLWAVTQIEQDSGYVVFRDHLGGITHEITDKVRMQNQVEAVYLASSNLDEHTLEVLPTLSEAHSVSFNSSAFADRHVGYLDGWTSLCKLQLNGTDITEVGLRHLSQQHRLTLLTLNDTSINDDAINALASMKTLRKLHLRNTNISDAGFNRLRSELGDCRIER